MTCIKIASILSIAIANIYMLRANYEFTQSMDCPVQIND